MTDPASGASVAVASEVGRLRRALVHEPGPEIDRMVPAMMEELLFDDILFGDRARGEHRRFRRTMQLLGVEVLDALDLLVEALADDGARSWVVEALQDGLPDAVRERMTAAAAPELADILVGGLTQQPVPEGVEPDALYEVSPVANWCFQRDPQVVLGGGVVLGAMSAPARHREALLARILFRFHPMLREVPVLFDPLDPGTGAARFPGPRPPGLEGGDLAILSREVLVVGRSERTRRATVIALARALARRDDGPRWMVVADLPQRRAFMHLDTVLTQIDRNACLVYPPVVLPEGLETARVWEIDLHARSIDFSVRDDLLSALARRGVDLEPIPCGGDDPVAQQREQWTDGANGLSVAPGVVLLYDRNTGTAEELARRGFRIVEAESLLLGHEELSLDDEGRVCVLLPSHELSRARGGPHCLVHPLVRDPL